MANSCWKHFSQYTALVSLGPTMKSSRHLWPLSDPRSSFLQSKSPVKRILVLGPLLNLRLPHGSCPGLCSRPDSPLATPCFHRLEEWMQNKESTRQRDLGRGAQGSPGQAHFPARWHSLSYYSGPLWVNGNKTMSVGYKTNPSGKECYCQVFSEGMTNKEGENLSLTSGSSS